MIAQCCLRFGHFVDVNTHWHEVTWLTGRVATLNFLPPRPNICHWHSDVTSDVAWSQHRVVNSWAHSSPPNIELHYELPSTHICILLLLPIHWSFLFRPGSHMLAACSSWVLLHITSRLKCPKHTALRTKTLLDLGNVSPALKPKCYGARNSIFVLQIPAVGTHS